MAKQDIYDIQTIKGLIGLNLSTVVKAFTRNNMGRLLIWDYNSVIISKNPLSSLFNVRILVKDGKVVRIDAYFIGSYASAT